MRDEIRALQTGANALGFPAGPEDGIWGGKTRGGLRALLDAHEGRWGDPVLEIGRALIDLGYLAAGPLSRVWTPELDRALSRLIAEGGVPRASAVVEPTVAPAGQLFRPDHDRQRYQGSAGYLISLFVLHTTATPGSWWKGKTNRAMFEEVRSWHLAKGWRDIGYHGLIFPDGEVIEGRAWDEIGAHVIGYNRGSLGYSMVPIATITRMGQPEDFYTAATLKAAKGKIDEACAQTQITRLAGHNEFAAKLCPGFLVEDSRWAPAGWVEAA